MILGAYCCTMARASTASPMPTAITVTLGSIVCWKLAKLASVLRQNGQPKWRKNEITKPPCCQTVCSSWATPWISVMVKSGAVSPICQRVFAAVILQPLNSSISTKYTFYGVKMIRIFYATGCMILCIVLQCGHTMFREKGVRNER